MPSFMRSPIYPAVVSQPEMLESSLRFAVIETIIIASMLCRRDHADVADGTCDFKAPS